VAPAAREHARERRKQRAIGGPRQGAPFLPSEHPQLMSQYEQLESLANSLCRPPDQQPQHCREGEISDRKEHAPVLSPPAARTSEQQTLSSTGGSKMGLRSTGTVWCSRARA
jgi:hypothetical protein